MLRQELLQRETKCCRKQIAVGPGCARQFLTQRIIIGNIIVISINIIIILSGIIIIIINTNINRITGPLVLIKLFMQGCLLFFL